MFCSNCGTKLENHIKFCTNCGKESTNHSQTHTPTNNPTQNTNNSTIVGEYNVASLNRRFANNILDGIFIWIGSIIIIVVMATVTGDTDSDTAGSIFGIIYLLWSICYYPAFEYFFQKTPAKFITKTKVVTYDGNKPKFITILGRNLARLIPFEPLSFLFGKGWHDTLSKTLVVPSHYTPEQVQKIDRTLKPKKNKILLVIGIGFIGIFILGLLSSIVLLSLNSARGKARDAERLSEVRQIASALELYYNDFETYPETLMDLKPKYITETPIAPTPQDGTCTAADNYYTYIIYDKDDYDLDFCLGQNTGGYEAGIRTLTPTGIK